MKSLKVVLLSVLFMVLGIGSVFILELFLNPNQTKLLILTIFLIFIVLNIFALVQIITGKTKLKFIKGRFHALLLVFLSTIFFIGISYISIYNVAVYEAFGMDITTSQKIEKFKELNNSMSLKKEQNSDLEDYIKDLNLDNIDYISLYYEDKIDKEYIQTIKETIPLAEDLVSRVYEDFEKTPVKVIFYSDGKAASIEGFDSVRVQGFFDGENIHIKNFNKEQPLWHIEQHFLHEYAHYAYNAYFYENELLNPLPAWFNEGIAEYISAIENGKEYSLEYLKNDVDLRELYTTEAFINSFGSEENTEEFYDPYMYAYYMIDSLVDLKGEDVIKDIILKSKDMNFYEAFEEVTEVSIEEYQSVNLVKYVEEMSLR